MIEQALIKTLGFGSKEFVEKAIEGGCIGYENTQLEWVGINVHRPEDTPYSILLSPAAWKAVGVSRGNKDEMRCTSAKCDTKLCEYGGYWPWNRKMVSFMETLALAEEESSKA